MDDIDADSVKAAKWFDMITIVEEPISFSFNGLRAGRIRLAKNKIVGEACGNSWSSSEHVNSNNAWNVNSGGTVGGNNKNNSNAVRAVAALGDEQMEAFICAMFDCSSHKRTAKQCVEYLILFEFDLPWLAFEVYNGQYQPTTSICFGVAHPNLREIFAANFRDRVVQHWVIIRVEPLLEDRFNETGNVSYNCRKGFGTQRAVTDAAALIERVTNNYSSEAWIGHYDIKSFFCSISKDVLWCMLESFITERYMASDRSLLLSIVKIIIYHRPCDDCIETGNRHILNRVPKHKRMKFNDPERGMGIGNITSQQFANFLLTAVDVAIMSAIKRVPSGGYIRFADDVLIITRCKNENITLRELFRTTLQTECQLKLNDSKIYLQRATNGVKFCGYVIKPGRIYATNRLVGHLYMTVTRLESSCHRFINGDATQSERIQRLADSANSIMGYATICLSYAIKRKLFSGLYAFWKVCYMTNHYSLIKLRRKQNGIHND